MTRDVQELDEIDRVVEEANATPADLVRIRRGTPYRRITARDGSFDHATTIGSALVTALGVFYPSIVSDCLAEGLRHASL